MSKIQSPRTDLAVEAKTIWENTAGKTTTLPGVEARDTQEGSFNVTTVKILNNEGAEALGKPVGEYITVELNSLLHREENAFADAANLVAAKLRELLKMIREDTVLVVGLGNPEITPDAIGPQAISAVMVTRHLRERLPEYFGSFRSVTAVNAGVLGTTGIESADMIASVARVVRPDKIIAIDALASVSMDRLCRTLQITDTGIVPGSGVGNARAALSAESMGVPVIAIGAPTVVDVATLVSEMVGTERNSLNSPALEDNGTMIVTPREIDKNVKDVSKLIAYGINLALHEDLTIEDIDMFVS